MISSRPVERVTALLQESGYIDVGATLEVGEVAFSFTRILIASGISLDVVIVIDTVEYPLERRLARSIEALSRALDILGSRRSLTLVVVGPVADAETLRFIARFCRVLHVGTPTGSEADQEVRTKLAVLTPLSVPADKFEALDPLGRLRREFNREPALIGVIDASERSAESVTSEVRAWLVSAARKESADG